MLFAMKSLDFVILIMRDQCFVTSVHGVSLFMRVLLHFQVLVLNLARNKTTRLVAMTVAALIGEARTLRKHTTAAGFDLLGAPSFII